MKNKKNIIYIVLLVLGLIPFILTFIDAVSVMEKGYGALETLRVYGFDAFIRCFKAELTQNSRIYVIATVLMVFSIYKLIKGKVADNEVETKDKKKTDIIKILKIVSSICLILILGTYIVINSSSNYVEYNALNVFICLIISLLLVIFIFKSKSEKYILKLILVILFIGTTFFIPAYKRNEKYKNKGAPSFYINLASHEVHRNVFGIKIWSEY